MSPDDPRHGTYAGYHVHYKSGEVPCDPCRLAQRRYSKRMHLKLARGQRQRVALGPDAWQIIHDTPRRTLSRATGIRDSHLSRLHTAGPEVVVYERTRQKVLAGRRITPVGIHRRLRGLIRLGYSAAQLARETGISTDRVRRITGSDEPPKFVREPIERSISEAFARLVMQPAPASRSATQARRRAERRGWPSAWAWDDIDDPNEQPKGIGRDPYRTEDSVDHAVVERVLGGDKKPRRLTKAEAALIVQALIDRGETTWAIRHVWGFRPERYVKRGDAA